MPITVYADTLLFLNVFITYFLLLSTQMLCRRPLRRGRVLLASMLGGAYALVVLLPPLPTAAALSLRAAVCVLLRWVADGFGSLRRFLKGTAVFLAVNFVFAGLMLALQMLRPDKLLYIAGAVYLDVSVPFILVSTLLAFALVRLCMRLSAGRRNEACSAQVTLTHAGRSVTFSALADTGHSLTDSFTGKPVLITQRSLLSPLAPAPVQDFLSGKQPPDDALPQEYRARLRMFPYKSVGGQGLLPAFRCEQARIRYGGRTLVCREVYVAATEDTLSSGEYDMLLPQEMLEETCERRK